MGVIKSKNAELKRKINEIKRQNNELEFEENSKFGTMIESRSKLNSNFELINKQVNFIVQKSFINKAISINSSIESISQNLSQIFNEDSNQIIETDITNSISAYEAMFVNYQLALSSRQEISHNTFSTFHSKLPSNNIKSFIKFLNLKIDEKHRPSEQHRYCISSFTCINAACCSFTYCIIVIIDETFCFIF